MASSSKKWHGVVFSDETKTDPRAVFRMVINTINVAGRRLLVRQESENPGAY